MNIRPMFGKVTSTGKKVNGCLARSMCRDIGLSRWKMKCSHGVWRSATVAWLLYVQIDADSDGIDKCQAGIVTRPPTHRTLTCLYCYRRVYSRSFCGCFLVWLLQWNIFSWVDRMTLTLLDEHFSAFDGFQRGGSLHRVLGHGTFWQGNAATWLSTVWSLMITLLQVYC